MTYQLRYGFGEEMVMAAIGAGMRGPAPEMEVGQHLSIRQWPQKQLLREIFFGDRSQGSFEIENWGEK